MRVKKGKVPYWEAYEYAKKKRDEATALRRAEEEKKLHESYSSGDEGFDASLGAMIGTMMAINNNEENNDTSTCNTDTNYDTNDSFDSDF